MSQSGPGKRGGLGSGFESPDLDRPGRQLHQQGLSEARLGCQAPKRTADPGESECTCRHCM